jgi:hypothetical protein
MYVHGIESVGYKDNGKISKTGKRNEDEDEYVERKNRRSETKNEMYVGKVVSYVQKNGRRDRLWCGVRAQQKETKEKKRYQKGDGIRGGAEWWL